jgi:hypothetical protein
MDTTQFGQWAVVNESDAQPALHSATTTFNAHAVASPPVPALRGNPSLSIALYFLS